MAAGFVLAKGANRPIIIGVDEAGRGPLAGPVVAAAVVLGRKVPDGLDDSKKLSAKRRALLEPLIQRSCCWATGLATVEEIDQQNILQATMLAMTRAVAALCGRYDFSNVQVLIDGNLTPTGRCADWRWQARPIIGGDGLEPCISAASILAKEHRDRLMRALAQEHPHYGWDSNVGYGTRKHLEALHLYGPTVQHRRSFAPVAQLEMDL
jgi:ribonuclease HII